MLGAYSCHSCFLPLLERIAWDFCGVTLAVSSYHCLAPRNGDLHERVGNLHVCKAAVLQFTMYHCARVGDLHVCRLAALHFMRA